jgi:type I restriction enzyme, R subunit
MTRKKLLEDLAEAGFGKDELATLQKVIDAEKCDLFDVLEFIAEYSTNLLTREERVAVSQKKIFSLLEPNEKEFIEFVLNKYIETGVEELDQEKLPILLELKYHSINDASEKLGEVSRIREMYIEFQKHLYQTKIA